MTSSRAGWRCRPRYVSFSGHVGPSGDALQLPVHITSKDWQASDRLLAAIMTERHVPTKAINVGGRGTFDGVLTESFNDLHTNGRFTGEAIWAFAVRWGRTVGDVAIADNYVTVKDAVVGDPAAATIGVNGRFSIGSHAVDDELRGTFKVSKWPLKDFRDAFGLTNWPVEGVGSADLDLHGPYRHLMGTGTLRIDNGSAWQEPFDVATSTLTFEGTGLFMGGLEMRKGAGRMRGQALINWDNTYSFDATGNHVAVESLQDFKVPSAPLSGQLDFRVRGAGSFDLPTYTFQGHVADLFAADEGIGDVTGGFTVRGNDLTFTELRAESRRVQATGLGRISLVKPYDAELTLTATNTSIDPYLKLFATEPLYTRAVVSGTVRIAGPLTDVTGLVVDARIDDAALQLFDYNLANDGQLHFTYSNDALSIDTFNLKGADTKLALTGSVSRATRTVDLNLNGDANLAILQAFKGLGDLRVGGAGTLNAHLGGDFDQLRFSGQATLRDGRLRFPGLTRSLENVHGPITFSNGDLSFAGLRGAMGGGDIQFGGAVRFDGFKPVEYQLTAVGQSVQLRYPQGFESTATANLWMRGPVASPTLGGEVEVTRVRYLRPLSTDAGLLGLATARRRGRAPWRPRRPSRVRHSDQLRRPRARAVDAAHRDQGHHDLRQRGRPAGARHGQRADRHGPPRSRPRRVLLQREPLPHRHGLDRLHQPGADRAVLRRSGVDAGARQRADVHHHGARHGQQPRERVPRVRLRGPPAAHDDATAVGAGAVGVRHPDAAARRDPRSAHGPVPIARLATDGADATHLGDGGSAADGLDHVARRQRRRHGHSTRYDSVHAIPRVRPEHRDHRVGARDARQGRVEPDLRDVLARCPERDRVVPARVPPRASACPGCSRATRITRSHSTSGFVTSFDAPAVVSPRVAGAGRRRLPCPGRG